MIEVLLQQPLLIVDKLREEFFVPSQLTERQASPGLSYFQRYMLAIFNVVSFPSKYVCQKVNELTSENFA